MAHPLGALPTAHEPLQSEPRDTSAASEDEYPIEIIGSWPQSGFSKVSSAMPYAAPWATFAADSITCASHKLLEMAPVAINAMKVGLTRLNPGAFRKPSEHTVQQKRQLHLQKFVERTLDGLLLETTLDCATHNLANLTRAKKKAGDILEAQSHELALGIKWLGYGLAAEVASIMFITSFSPFGVVGLALAAGGIVAMRAGLGRVSNSFLQGPKRHRDAAFYSFAQAQLQRDVNALRAVCDLNRMFALAQIPRVAQASDSKEVLDDYMVDLVKHGISAMRTYWLRERQTLYERQQSIKRADLGWRIVSYIGIGIASVSATACLAGVVALVSPIVFPGAGSALAVMGLIGTWCGYRCATLGQHAHAATLGKKDALIKSLLRIDKTLDSYEQLLT